jgi:hypothetical protein
VSVYCITIPTAEALRCAEIAEKNERINYKRRGRSFRNRKTELK